MPEVSNQKQEPSQQKLIKKLEADKKLLEEKTKNLAKILELSAKQKTKAAPKATGELKTLQSELKVYTEEMKKNIKNLGKRLEKSKNTGEPVNQQVIDLINPIQEKIALLDKLPDLETRLAKLESIPEEEKPKKKEENLFGGFSEEGVVNEHLDNKLTKLDEVVNKKLKELEAGLSSIKLTLNPETLNNLKKLSDTSTDIINILIPAKVREEVDKILSSFSAEFRLLTQSLRKLTDDVEKSNSEIFYSLEEIEKLGANIERLEQRIDDIHKEMFMSSRAKS